MLNRNMCQNHDTRFAQNNLVLWSYGHSKNLVPFVNAVPAKNNPRISELHQVADHLGDLLPSNVMEPFIEDGRLPNDLGDKAKQVLARIDRNSNNRDGYAAPSDEVLLRGYTQRFDEVLSKPPCDIDGVCVVVEWK